MCLFIRKPFTDNNNYRSSIHFNSGCVARDKTTSFTHEMFGFEVSVQIVGYYQSSLNSLIKQITNSLNKFSSVIIVLTLFFHALAFLIPGIHVDPEDISSSCPLLNTVLYKNMFINRCLFQYIQFHHSSALYWRFFSSLYCVFLCKRCGCHLYLLKVT